MNSTLSSADPNHRPDIQPDQHGRSWAGVCLDRIRLSTIERDALRGYSADPAGPRAVRCHLPDGHPGPHASGGMYAIDRPVPRWLRWDCQRRELVDAPECDAVYGGFAEVAGAGQGYAGPAEADRCFLYRGHTGPHSYDYYPDRAWPFPDAEC